MLSEREARFRTRTLGWGSVVLLLITFLVFGPTPAFYLAVLIPWVAALVFRTGQGAIHLIVGKGDPRPELSHIYIFSAIWPAIVATGGFTPRPLQWGLLVVFGLLIGSLLAAAAVKNPRTWHWAGLIALLVVNSFYGLGVAAALNQDLDGAPAQTYTAQVVKKWTTRSRRDDNFHLRLAPWGPRSSWTEIDVGKRSYDSTPIGGIRCVELHQGALRIPWFETKPCQSLK